MKKSVYFRLILLYILIFFPMKAASEKEHSLNSDLLDSRYFFSVKESGLSSEEEEDPQRSSILTPEPSENTGFYKKTNAWRALESSASKKPNGNITIPVCWILDEDEIGKTLEGRNITKEAVSETWEQAAKVEFIGWNRCDPSKKGGIRIQIDKSNCWHKVKKAHLGACSYVGMESDKHSPSMWLDFSFNDWSKPCQKSISKSNWKDCIYSIAVHEFGHALGLEHEHRRLSFGTTLSGLQPRELFEKFKKCRKSFKYTFGSHKGDTETQLPNPIIFDLQDSYDSSSVMNYCFDIFSKSPLVLSAGDKKTIIRMYGCQGLSCLKN